MGQQQVNQQPKNNRGNPWVHAAIAMGAGLSAAGAAQAELIIADLDVTVSDGFQGLDFIRTDGVLGPDGFNDIFIDDRKAGFAGIKGTKISLKDKGGQRVSVALDPFNFGAAQFVAGDEVDGSANYISRAKLHGGGIGNWQNIGDTGYVGLEFRFFDSEDGEEDEEFSIHYGWLEITRGSTIVGQFGFQTTAFAAAPIPGGNAAVPEPAGLALLAVGAAGLMARRRKQKAAA